MSGVSDGRSGRPKVELQVLSELSELEAVRHEWEQLAATAPAYSGAQSPEYVLNGWIHGAGKAERLCVLTARIDGVLRAVWPLYQASSRGLVSVRHLGNGGYHEYAPPLVSGPASEQIIEDMFQFAVKIGDVFEAYNLPDASPLVKIIANAPYPTHHHNMKSPIVSLRGAPSWDSWIAAKSKSFRSGLRYDRSKLAGLGTLAFAEVHENGAASFVDWFFTQKARWLVERKIKGSWLVKAQTRAFYRSVIGREGPATRGFALTLDDKIIAGCICIESSDRLEYYITAFDPDYSAYSPGNLLLEECVKWCIDRKLDFDFRLSSESYKLRWSDRYDVYHTIKIASSMRGRLEIIRMEAETRLRALRSETKRRLLDVKNRMSSFRKASTRSSAK